MSSLRDSLLPKKETGVLNFLKENPEADGRGVIIAVLDSGVDPAVDGLRVTTTGEPKVIERYDCTGAGDVDTSSIVNPDENGVITGLSGRKFKIPAEWTSRDSGGDPVALHLGLKPVFELYTPSVRERIETKRRSEYFDPIHRVISGRVNNSRIEFAELNGSKKTANKENEDVQPLENGISPTKEVKTEPGSPSKVDKSSELLTSMLEKLEKEEIEAQIDMLNTLEKKYKDYGPILDCILLKGGGDWTICMISSEYSPGEEDAVINLADITKNEDVNKGNGCVIVGEYSKGQEFAVINKYDQMTISCNVWEDGKRLEIVSICSGHGTHVSCIAAGYFPDDPQLNGVAPGAQIISLEIGDNRLESMETGSALLRASAFLMANADRVQVINMSYGEHAHFASHGRIIEIMREVIDKFGITWVVSAGNHGPALSTIGTPPWIPSANAIGVGAYVSPGMMLSEYSLREIPSKHAWNGLPYTWTSRGPTLDGDLGLSICAPGGAITSVPNFTLKNAQLMNGTSMAAPHTAGVIALLISGALQQGIQWTPYTIKRALENTASGNVAPLSLNALKASGSSFASILDSEDDDSKAGEDPEEAVVTIIDPYAQGFGLVKVPRAFEALTLMSKTQELGVRFNITVSPVGGNPTKAFHSPMRGIYIRENTLSETDGGENKFRTLQKEYNVTVEPYFFKENSIDPTQKINFRMGLALISADPAWVKVPKYLDLANAPRSFNAKIDLNYLDGKSERGGVIYSRIMAYDMKDLSPKGPIFCVHITVVRPYSQALLLRSVTSLKPRSSPYGPFTFGSKSYKPGEVRRGFFNVPKGATWAVLTLKLEELLTWDMSNLRSSRTSQKLLDLDTDSEIGAQTQGGNGILNGDSKNSTRFIIHCMNIIPNHSCKTEEYYKMTTLHNSSARNGEEGGSANEIKLYFRVVENRVLEVSIGRWWAENCNELALLTSTLKFRSLKISPDALSLCSSDAYQRVVVSNYSSDGTEDIAPSASLKTQVLLLRAIDMKIVSLGDRDTIDLNGGKRVSHELRATYQFSVHRAAEIALNCTLLSDTLYECEYDSQLWMIFDCNKRYITSSDAYPSKWFTKLEKGDYFARLSIRHEKREALERFYASSAASTNGGNGSPSGSNGGSSSSSIWAGESSVPSLPVTLIFKLSTPISLEIYGHLHELQSVWDKSKGKKGSGGGESLDLECSGIEEGSSRAYSIALKKGSTSHFFISSLINDKNLKGLPGGPMTVSSSSSTSTTCPLYFQGTLTVSKDENGKKLLTHPLKLFVPPSSEPSPSTLLKLAQSSKSKTSLNNSTSSSDSSEDANAKSGLQDDLRDVKIGWISKIWKSEGLSTPIKAKTSREIYEELIGDHPRHLPLHLTWLQALDSHLQATSEVKGKEELLESIVKACDEIIELVDSTELLIFYGVKTPLGQQMIHQAGLKGNESEKGPKGATPKAQMDKKKSALIEALIRKGMALLELYGIKKSDEKEYFGRIDGIYMELQKYLELGGTGDSRVGEFAIEYARVRCGHSGRAAKMLHKVFEGAGEPGGGGKWTKEQDKKMIGLFRELGWGQAVWLWEGQNKMRWGNEFRPF